MSLAVATTKFQFLDRNSFGSDADLIALKSPYDTRFNSSIGILSVRTRLAKDGVQARRGVSIPRSEFFRFGHGA